jgi:hypothetical protein
VSEHLDDGLDRRRRWLDREPRPEVTQGVRLIGIITLIVVVLAWPFGGSRSATAGRTVVRSLSAWGGRLAVGDPGRRGGRRAGADPAGGAVLARWATNGQ